MKQVSGWQRAKQWLTSSSGGLFKPVRLRADTGLSVLDDSLFTAGYSSYGTAAGMRVSPEHAMRLAAVYACVRVISETMASLPLIIYKRLPDHGKERATEHPLYDLFRKSPNRVQTPFNFFQTMNIHMELRGNSFAFINPGLRGAIDSLVTIHPDRVKVFRIDQQKVRYEISDWYTGKVEKKAQEEILHDRGQSQDGLVGQSTIAQARETMGAGLAQQDYASRFFENDSTPGGVLEHPAGMSDEAYARLKKSFQEAQTGANRHKVVILEEGTKWHQVSVSNKDSQFLEAREFTRAEVCGLFRVPPHKIGDLTKATFSNIEEQNIEFVTDCIVPRATRLEERINMDLIEPLELADGEEYFAEFLLDNLLRGNLKSRYEAYTQGRNAGFLSINDIRKRENMNPLDDDGADDYLRPLNYVPIDTPVQQSDPTVPLNEPNSTGKTDPESTGTDDAPDPTQAN